MKDITPQEKAFIHSLQKKKQRQIADVFVVENPLTLRDALRSNVLPKQVVLTDRFQYDHPDVMELLKPLPKDIVSKMSQRDEAYLSQLESPQGVVALYQKKENSCDFSQPVLYLDAVSDPGNVGSLMRSAAAFGVVSVVFGEKTADPYNPKTISAAKESIFSLKLSQNHDISTIAGHMPVYGLVVKNGASVNTVNWESPFCLVVGNEAHGIQSHTREHLTTEVTIPMEPGRVESLNASVSGAIALSQAFMSLSNRIP